jgi:hypothetical protein
VNKTEILETRKRKRPITYGEEYAVTKNKSHNRKKTYIWISKDNEAISNISSTHCLTADVERLREQYLAMKTQLNKEQQLSLDSFYKTAHSLSVVARRRLDGVPIVNVEGLHVAASKLKRKNCDMGNGKASTICTFLFK